MGTVNFGERNALGDCYLEMGKTLVNLKRFGEATDYLNQAIAHYEAVAERDAQNLSARRQIFYTCVRLADALAGRGELGRARRTITNNRPPPLSNSRTPTRATPNTNRIWLSRTCASAKFS